MLQSDSFLSMQQLHALRQRPPFGRTRIEENLERHEDGRADWLPFLHAVRQGDLARCKHLYEAGRAHPMRDRAVPYAIMVLAQLRPDAGMKDQTSILAAWLWEMHVEVLKAACPWHKIRQKHARWRRFVWGTQMVEPVWHLPAARQVSILTRWLEWAQLGNNTALVDDLQRRLNEAEQRMQAEAF